MSNLSVAVICREAHIAERLVHCLDFIGVAATVVDRAQAGGADVLVTDDATLADGNPAAVRIRCAGDRAGSAVCAATLCWPPRYNDLVGALARASRLAGDRAGAMETFPDLVGCSDALLAIKHLMVQVADSDATVLVTGESGTGKEVVARSLHEASARGGQPFVPVNCGAIPSELLESELFGHEKGAFTGALETKKGRFELAHGGTLFLDEIGDMPLQMQVKVLRALQDKAVERIGSARSVPCNVRIIAATNQDLETLISEGRFREDLYYRLAVFPLVLPPLRERGNDMALIAHDMLARLAREQGVTVTLSTAAWEVLKAYEWPGNVRELTNFLQRVAIQFPNGVLDVEDLPLRMRGARTGGGGLTVENLTAEPNAPHAMVLPVNGLDLRTFLGDLERSLIEQALNDTDSVVARAADRLHIRRTTLVEKMRKYGLRRSEA